MSEESSEWFSTKTTWGANDACSARNRSILEEIMSKRKNRIDCSAYSLGVVSYLATKIASIALGMRQASTAFVVETVEQQ